MRSNKNHKIALFAIAITVTVGIAFSQKSTRVQAEEKVYTTPISMNRTDEIESNEDFKIEESSDIIEDYATNETSKKDTDEHVIINLEQSDEIEDSFANTGEHEKDEPESIDNESIEKQDEIATFDDLTPRGEKLKDNEVIVYSFSEFAKLIRDGGNGVYDTYYMGADFDVTFQPSPKKNYSFTLDGRDFETGEIHTYRASATSSVMSVSNTDKTSIVYRNMHVEGGSTNGIIRSFNDMTDTIMDRVNYSGPLLIYNLKGQTIYKDVKITSTGGSNAYFYKGNDLLLEGIIEMTELGGAYGDAFSAAGGKVVLSENARVSINVDGSVLSSNDLVLNSGSSLDVNVDNVNIIFTNVFSVKNLLVDNAEFSINVNNDYSSTSAAIAADILELRNSKLNIYMNTNASSAIRGDKGLYITENSEVNIDGTNFGSGVISSISKGGEIVFNDSDISVLADTVRSSIVYSIYDNIEISNTNLTTRVGSSTRPEINAGKSIKITDKSNVDIEIEKTQMTIFDAKDEIIVDDSDILINLSSQQSSANNYGVITSPVYSSHNARLVANLNDMEYKSMFNVTKELSISGDEGTLYWHTINNIYDISFVFPGKTPIVKIYAEQVNTYNTQPNSKDKPTTQIRKPDYSNGNLEFKVNPDGTLNFIKNEFDNGNLPNPKEELDLQKQKVISIGGIPFEIHEEESSQEYFSATTIPGAELVLTYNKTLQKEAIADVDGRIKLSLYPSAEVDYHFAELYAHNLYREHSVDYTYLGRLDIIELPTSIDFGLLSIPQKHTVYDRVSPIKIVVEDTRYNKKGWKLEVRLKSPLIEENGRGRDLENSLVYKDNSDAELKIMDSNRILVYETPAEYGDITEITLPENEGILLELMGANGIYSNSSYSGEVEWILTSK